MFYKRGKTQIKGNVSEGLGQPPSQQSGGLEIKKCEFEYKSLTYIAWQT